MTPGKVVNIPAEVKHWHGAASDSWFSHLAIEIAGEETADANKNGGTLVVYFSATGTTKEVAEKIAGITGARHLQN